MKQPLAIPEDRVPGILARAAELDRQTITLDALRAAALEAGISAAAVDQALQEYATGKMTAAIPAPEPVPETAPRWRRWLRKLAFPMKLAALGILLGVVGAVDEEIAAISIFVLIALSSRFAWRDRGTGHSARFQVGTVVLSVSTFLAMVAAEGDEDALGFIAFFAMALLVLGTALIHFRSSARPRAEDVRTA